MVKNSSFQILQFLNKFIRTHISAMKSYMLLFFFCVCSAGWEKLPGSHKGETLNFRKAISHPPLHGFPPDSGQSQFIHYLYMHAWKNVCTFHKYLTFFLFLISRCFFFLMRRGWGRDFCRRQMMMCRRESQVWSEACEGWFWMFHVFFFCASAFNNILQ